MKNKLSYALLIIALVGISSQEIMGAQSFAQAARELRERKEREKREADARNKARLDSIKRAAEEAKRKAAAAAAAVKQRAKDVYNAARGR